MGAWADRLNEFTVISACPHPWECTRNGIPLTRENGLDLDFMGDVPQDVKHGLDQEY
jgi:hypothetical protein